jgi:hypothetical protein
VGDAALAGVRDPGPLAKLPAAKREQWQNFWADVRVTLTDARKPAPPPPTGSDKK